MRIFIAGDSFAADWTVKYNDYLGWPNILHKYYTVTNAAQAGVSEYKIYRQICNVDIANFDAVIVCHTLPGRIVTSKHPVHWNDCLHGSADLIFSDVEHHAQKWKNFGNRSLQSARDFFKYHYDQEYQDTTYQLLRQACVLKLQPRPCLTLNFVQDTQKFISEANVIDFVGIIESGLINHMSENSNLLVAKRVQHWLQSL